jgi:uncharacterized membrane protein YfcA
LLALLAEIIGTVSGFGSSILFVPIASIFFDIRIVLGITAIFHLFSNVSKIMLFRKGFDKSIIIKMGIPAVLMVLIGAILSKYIPESGIEVFMSFVLILLSVYLVVSKRVIEPSNQNLVIGGGISGFLAGLIGTGGAIRGIALSAFNLSKDVFIATSAFIDLGVDSGRAIVYALNGYVPKETILLVPILIGISVLGTWLGKLTLNRMNEDTFKYVVLGIIILSSLVHIIKVLI